MPEFTSYHATSHPIIKKVDDYNNILDHAFEKSVSYIVRKNSFGNTEVLSGSGQNAGKLVSGVSTIQGAHDLMASGGTMAIKEGTFSENVTISNQKVTILSSPATYLDGTLTVNAEDSYIVGFPRIKTLTRGAITKYFFQVIEDGIAKPRVYSAAELILGNMVKLSAEKPDKTVVSFYYRDGNAPFENVIGEDGYANAFKHNVTIGVQGTTVAPFVRFKDSGSVNAHDLVSENDVVYLKNDAGFTKWATYMPLNWPHVFDNGNVEVSTTNVFRMRCKAGVPNDADMAAPVDGAVIIDTTNSRIYVRIGGAWKQVGVA